MLALFPKFALAHCPLCTIGAGALAVAAASVGVSTATVGVFIGAFALALSIWVAKLIKKKYFRYQDALVTLAIFLSTVIPIMPFIREYRPFYIALVQEYGTLLHNTYTINLYLLGVIVGAVLLFVAPYISASVTKLRGGRILPFQGMGITLFLVVLGGVIFQLTM